MADRAPKSSLGAHATAANSVAAAMRGCWRHFSAAFIFSLIINLFYLAPTIYMMQVSDRVMTSGSRETLAMLTIALVLTLLAMELLDIVRARILIRSGFKFDAQIADQVVAATVDLSLRQRGVKQNAAVQALDNFRQFITGPGVHAFFDLPWVPIYLLVLFVIHPALGVTTTIFMALLVLLAILTETATAGPMKQAGQAGMRSYALAEAAHENAEVVQAMGMLDGLLHRWNRDRVRMLVQQAIASDLMASLSSGSKFLRLLVQSLLLGLGSVLALDGSITSGGMFASMLLVARATQPIDQVVATWRSVVLARNAYNSLKMLFQERPTLRSELPLPRPKALVTVDRLSFMPNGQSKPVLFNLSFQIDPGTALAVIGPSAAGKSTLARLLVGVVAPTAGEVRLDGANVSIWNKSDLGQYMGYLPQDVELFEGTVAENISRFTDGPSDAIVRAAMAAGAHEMILRLPAGYDTQIGEGGALLSGGQRQRLGLARAVYGDPVLVVLDEPNSNMDTEGELAMARCIAHLKAANKAVVLVTHRPANLSMVENVLYLNEGRAAALLPRDQMLARLAQPNVVAPDGMPQAGPAAAPQVEVQVQPPMAKEPKAKPDAQAKVQPQGQPLGQTKAAAKKATKV